LKVEVERLGNISILHLKGRIVIGETDILWNTINSQQNVGAVIIDLAGVSQIDARGLGVLLRLREQVQSEGIEFRIMNVTELVQQVLEITRLNTVFEVASERDLLPLTTSISTEKTENEVTSVAEA
jgi:anti-anti-sigma factor